MGRNSKNLPLLQNVEILDAGAEGKAVARVEGMVVFTTNVIPGDVVDIQVKKKREIHGGKGGGHSETLTRPH